MNWIVFGVLTGLIVFNLLGVGIWHYEYAHETHKVIWKKDKSFWVWTVMLLLFGTAYCVLRLILYLRGLFAS